MRSGDYFEHLKTGDKYKILNELGIKLFGMWFYLIVYQSRDPRIRLTFIRTKKSFKKKFIKT